MRYMFAIVAGLMMTIGVASARDTGFGDWDTASYDLVMDSYVINSSSYFSPEPVVNSVSSTSSSSSNCGCDSSSSSWNSWSSNDYSYGPVEYGDDDWDWYTL